MSRLASDSSPDENSKGRKLEDESIEKRFQEYYNAISSTPPTVPVEDPLVGLGFSNPAYLEAMYKVSSNECPAYQNDFQYVVESYQMLIQGYDKFFHSRAFNNGAVFAPGQVRTKIYFTLSILFEMINILNLISLSSSYFC